MKAKDFGKFLSAFANLLADAGATESARMWRVLLPMFEVRPSASVKDVCNVITQIDGGGQVGAPTVQDLVRMLSAMEQCFSQSAKKEFVDDFKRFGDSLCAISKTPLVDLADGAVNRLETLTSGSARKPAMPTADIQDYLRRLEESLDSRERFVEIFDILKNDKSVKAPDAKRLAREFTKQSAKSKTDALSRIWERHASLIEAGAKAKTTGGRTAA